MWAPGFPQSFAEVLAMPNAKRDLVLNWLYRLLTGAIRYAACWSFDSPEFSGVPKRAAVAGATLVVALPHLWKQARNHIHEHRDTVIFAGLGLGHLLAYSVFSLAFLLDRFVLYALPVSTFFVLKYLSTERNAKLRLLVGAVLAGVALLSSIEFVEVYRDWLNPYSQKFVDARTLSSDLSVELVVRPRSPLPTATVHSFSYPPSLEWQYGWLFQYLPPEGIDAPERQALFLPRAVLLRPYDYVLETRKDGRTLSRINVADLHLETRPMAWYFR
jgi:hypothetical protein